MRDAVNDYLEPSGANRPSIGGEKTILAHRIIAANRRGKHEQSIEQCLNTMPCKEEEEDTQPTASMLCPKMNYPKWTGSSRLFQAIFRGNEFGCEGKPAVKDVCKYDVRVKPWVVLTTEIKASCKAEI